MVGPFFKHCHSLPIAFPRHKAIDTSSYHQTEHSPVNPTPNTCPTIPKVETEEHHSPPPVAAKVPVTQDVEIIDLTDDVDDSDDESPEPHKLASKPATVTASPARSRSFLAVSHACFSTRSGTLTIDRERIPTIENDIPMTESSSEYVVDDVLPDLSTPAHGPPTGNIPLRGTWKRAQDRDDALRTTRDPYDRPRCIFANESHGILSVSMRGFVDSLSWGGARFDVLDGFWSFHLLSDL